MKRIIFAIFCLLSFSIQAQQSYLEKFSLPSYDCSQRGFKNINDNDLIIVIPNDSLGLLSANFKKHIESLGKIKKESQLQESDLKKSLWILGPINRYSNWNKFGVPIQKVKNGFKIDEFAFTDSLHSFNFITDSLTTPLRIVVSGNSLKAFEQANRMHMFGFKYSILKDCLPILLNDGVKSIDLDSIRKIHYVAKESDYFTFMLSKDISEDITQQLTAESMKRYDLHVEQFVNKMELRLPTEKIINYIHACQDEIIYNTGLFVMLCNTGTVNGFVTGSTIHSTGLDAIEHEANHQLFAQVNDRAPIFFAEGIQKWHEFSIDYKIKEKGFIKAKEFFNEDLTGVIKGTSSFFQGDKYYLISGIFVDFLITEYGLNKFKEIYLYQTDDVDSGFKCVYGKSLSLVLQDYQKWLLK